jgi:hypothetical protein
MSIVNLSRILNLSPLRLSERVKEKGVWENLFPEI